MAAVPATGMNAVNAAVETETAVVIMKAVAAVIVAAEAEIAVMFVRTMMTAAAEMISVRSLALSQGHFPLTKAICAAVRNLKTIMTADNKAVRWLIVKKCAGYPAHFFYNKPICEAYRRLVDKFDLKILIKI